MQHTIASIATAQGLGGIAIVRISGKETLPILRQAFQKKKSGPWQSHRLYYGHACLDGQPIDEAMAVFMRAPNSYTKEDVAEIHCHGGDTVAKAVLNALFALGASPAEPGEFTKRAFLNGRISLNQAEAVMELIASKTERAAKSALSAMGSGLTKTITKLQQTLMDVAASLEAYIDYPGEDMDMERQALSEARAKIQPIQAFIQEAIETAAGRNLLQTGVSIVLFGRPNAGKSSLLNRLVDHERAIVTEIPGTTRDVLREQGSLYGIPCVFSDTAGLRDTIDAVEKIGVERARQELEQADVLLMVLDASAPLAAQLDETLDAGRPYVIALNKMDLSPILDEEQIRAAYPNATVVGTCALTGEGVEALRTLLYDRALTGRDPEGSLLHNERQIQAAKAAIDSLKSAHLALSDELMDCAALDLRAAYHSLGLITGLTADESIIDRIFEKFCLGK